MVENRRRRFTRPDVLGDYCRFKILRKIKRNRLFAFAWILFLVQSVKNNKSIFFLEIVYYYGYQNLTQKLAKEKVYFVKKEEMVPIINPSYNIDILILLIFFHHL